MPSAGGPHSAVGNRPVRPEDAEVIQRIKSLLKEKCPYGNCCDDLQLGFADGVITVKGTVTSYYQRQVILNLLLKAPDIDQINDQIRVQA